MPSYRMPKSKPYMINPPQGWDEVKGPWEDWEKMEMRLALLRRKGYKRTTGKKIGTTIDAVRFFRSLTLDPREGVYGVYLTNKNVVMGIMQASAGTRDSSPVDIPILLAPAIISGATAIIIVHNHPSGEPRESADDVLLSKKLKQAAELMQFAFHDFLIIGETDWTSFRAKGIL